MIERKNIDKLFQEKFKDFESMPSEEMWPRIEEKLKEKKKRRVIPIWWKLSGIAAALLIGFLISDGMLNRKTDGTNGDNVVVDGDSKPETNTNAPTVVDTTSETAVVENDPSESEQTKQTTTEKNTNGLSNPKNNISGSKNDANSGLVINEKSNADGNSTNPKNKTKSNNGNKNQLTPSNDQQLVVNERNSDANNNPNQSNKKRRVNKVSKSQNAPAENQQGIAVVSQGNKKAKSALKNPATDKSNLLDQHANKPSGNDSKINSTDSKIAQSDSKSNASDSNQSKTIDQPVQNQQLANKDISKDKKLDSTAIATVVPNALEELLNEKENNLVTKGPQINRWQITSSVAPIYFGSTSGGSPIDSTFSGNSKEYKTNLSIRLGVNYAINKKLTIRTGVSNVTFDYNTKDVLIYAGMDRNSLPNVNTTGQNQYLHFGRRSSVQTAAAANSTNLSTDEFNSYLNQRMGYIEVPLELSYALIDKKIGINIIGGISTLFLNENKILVISDGLTTNLGEANNLNKTHFSSNVGLGVKYRFYKAFQANFEPMFKYQINTFSKDAGNFKPYYFGLYTGISYSF